MWRFPVKSMAGERLSFADITEAGVTGDRLVQVQDRRGKLMTSRTCPALLRFKGSLGPDGEPRVDGRPWSDASVAAEVERAAGPGARLVRVEVERRFDIMPLLVGTDGAFAAVGEDTRRFRPNLVLGGVPGLEERTWGRHLLEIGACRIVLADLRDRCVMTTFHPDTQVQDKGVLARIGERFGGKLCLNALVLVPGCVAVGDEALVSPLPRELAEKLGIDV
jgi:uncharacterized protein